MVDINQSTVEQLLSDSNSSHYNEVLSDINILVDYANHVATMEEKLKSYPRNSGMYAFMAKNLDEQRREKHDRALYCLAELNGISQKLGLELVYPGDLNSETARNEAADSIYEFCKRYLLK